MRRLTTPMLGILALAFATAVLGAQQGQQPTQPTQPTAKPGTKSGGGHVAGITPAPPVVAIPGTNLVLTAPANAGGPPVVLLPDGRLFANFGRGYEQVVQACGFSPYIDYGAYDGGSYGVQAPQPPQPPAQTGATQPVVVQPTVTQPTTDPVLPVVSVPIIPSPAISMSALPSQVTTLGQPVVNPSACWSRDRRGRIFVAVP